MTMCTGGQSGGGGSEGSDDDSTDAGGFAPPPPPIPAPEAAAALVSSFTPAAIQIGMTPKVNSDWGHRRSYVGLPIWMWVADPSPSSWGVYSYSGSTGGQTITFEAQVSTVTWSMGDGTTVTCGMGSIYSPAYGNVSSPSCGHKYTQTSKARPGGMYTVTATSNWVISWTSATDGSTGTLTASASTSTQVQILELQSVNT
ncbi:hypothetical protein F8O04_14485 [Pseudoclavibacter endophyticus]|uniref:ATP/GTP-binding protein n=1 Tax=Pseudoclavibacter endophyticus TaxID=1778590 RepID=A0A6H9WJU3_9MICO|nr:hypothetical protein F8O04_14485 [Pseudoclavibacter endophyticus]